MLARRGVMGVGTPRSRFGPKKMWPTASSSSRAVLQWRPTVAALGCDLAGSQAARDTHGPGEREFAVMFDCPEGDVLGGEAVKLGMELLAGGPSRGGTGIPGASPWEDAGCGGAPSG